MKFIYEFILRQIYGAFISFKATLNTHCAPVFTILLHQYTLLHNSCHPNYKANLNNCPRILPMITYDRHIQVLRHCHTTRSFNE